MLLSVPSFLINLVAHINGEIYTYTKKGEEKGEEKKTERAQSSGTGLFFS